MTGTTVRNLAAHLLHLIDQYKIDILKYELKEERKAFDKLHKKHMDLLKQQGELEKENEQLKEENKQLLLFKNNYRKRRGVVDD